VHSKLDERSVSTSRAAQRHDLLSLLPLLEITCSVLLAVLLLWKGILPGWRMLNTDFPNYYLVARLLREGYSLDRIYDWIWLQRIKDHWGLDQALVGFAGLTPFSALPIVPLALLPALVAKRLWILTNVLFLGSTVELLSRVTTLGRRRIWLLALLAIFPLRTSFLFGQMHLLVLLLLVAAYYFDRKGRQVACGVCLAIAGVLKIYPLLVGGYFAWKRQWRLALAMLGATLLLVGAGYLVFGSSLMNIYATQILPRSFQGEVLDPYSVHAASGAALFHRLFIAEPALNPAPLLSSPSLYALLYPLWQLAILVPLLAVSDTRGNQPRTGQLEWAAFVFALLVLSPVPSSYHFVVMIFSMVLLVDVLLARGEYRVAGLAVALYGLISIVDLASAGHGALFARLWLGQFLWAVFLFCLWPDREQRKLLRADSLRTVSLCAMVAVGWSTSVYGYYRHFAYLGRETAYRIPEPVAAYLASAVRPTSSGFVFTAMLPGGYRVVDQGGNDVWIAGKQPTPVDELSFASVPNTHAQLLELADSAGSRIVTVSNASSAKGPENIQLLFSDAESPAISADGRYVAFIREIDGRGTLWIATLNKDRSKVESGPNRILEQPYDVRDVTFASSGWMMFAARVNGGISIFSMVRGEKPRMFLSLDEEVDSPAISPNERFVAFRRLVRNRWQLAYIDVAAGREHILTSGDCNSYSPTWIGPLKVAYATDCGRGLGLSALAVRDIGPESDVPGARP
jgi:Glycosyltransferase family 87